MKTWSRFAAFLLLALWLPATQHCDLEAAGVEFLTHGDHASTSCQDACKDDVCHNIEDIAVTKEVGALRVLPPVELKLRDHLLAVLALRLSGEAAPPDYGEHSPELLVLQRTWSFVHRTALPARAPDCAA